MKPGKPYVKKERNTVISTFQVSFIFTKKEKEKY